MFDDAFGKLEKTSEECRTGKNFGRQWLQHVLHTVVTLRNHNKICKKQLECSAVKWYIDFTSSKCALETHDGL